MENFIDWLDDLDIQTLTDELKKEILERVEVLVQDAYGDGYFEAKDNMLNYLDSM